MNILGISGLESAEPFKRENWPGRDEREYRISQGYDAAAALVVNGVPFAAAAEERFDRRKHSGRFPASAIRYCLNQSLLSLDEIDVIAHSFDYSAWCSADLLLPLSRRFYREVLAPEVLLSHVQRDLPGFPHERVRHVNHHMAHAASAYFTSGWDDALVIVADAMGESQSISVYRGHCGELEKIREISALHSVGILYSLVTLHLGFEFNSDEYKIMGLAPYGDPGRFRSFFDQTVQFRPDGTIAIPILGCNQTREEREFYTGTRRYLSEHLIPPRRPNDEIRQEHRDAAAALQACLDGVMLHIARHFRAATGCRRLAMAGGVALNCTANGRLLKEAVFDEVYVQPASGDDGSALGAALYWASRVSEICNSRFPPPFLGPVYSAAEIDDTLAEFGNRVRTQRFRDTDEACAAAARLIADGKVVAWYRGRMEFGPRALGHRSILADPRRPEMRDRINAMVKKREAFRPFAPAVTLEEVHRWFDVPPGTALPYMIATADVRPEHRAQLPAVTHVDGSARVQTVSRAECPDFHSLLESVGMLTGRAMVLNTSFNVKGQPIVNTPREAVETFLSTEIDALFIENVLIRNAARRIHFRSEVAELSVPLAVPVESGFRSPSN